jgi:hypothetical protein
MTWAKIPCKWCKKKYYSNGINMHQWNCSENQEELEED